MKCKLNLTSFRHRLRHEIRRIVRPEHPIPRGNPRKKRSEILPKSSIDRPDPFTRWCIVCTLFKTPVCFHRWRIEQAHTWRRKRARKQRNLILLNKTKNLYCIQRRSIQFVELVFVLCCCSIKANNRYSTSDAKCFNFFSWKFVFLESAKTEPH